MAAGYSQKSASAVKEYSNFNHLKSLAVVISNLENEYGDIHIKPIELENIRINNSNLRFEELTFAPAHSANEAFLTEDKEEKMQVEDWMLNEEHFRINNSSELYENAEEEEIIVEDWMLDESHFLSNNNLIEDENTAEDELKVENWMLDPDHWVSRAD